MIIETNGIDPTIIRISWQGKPSKAILRLVYIQATHPINKVLKKLSFKNCFDVIYAFASTFFSPLVLVQMTRYDSQAY